MLRSSVSKWLCLLLLFLAPRLHAQGFDPVERADAIAPFVDEQVFAVGRLDPSKIDLPALRKLLIAKVPNLPKESEEEFAKGEAMFTKYIAELKKAGMVDMYWVASLADPLPNNPPLMVVRLTKSADPKEVSALIFRGPVAEGVKGGPPPAGMSGEVIRGELCLGTPEVLARIRALKPLKRDDLATAFKAAGDTAVQVVVLQSEDTRRVLTETLPSLPGKLSDYSGKDLADGVRYAALGIDLGAKPKIQFSIQSQDARSAKKLRQLAIEGLALGGEVPALKQMFPDYDATAKLFVPQQQEDRLSLTLSEDTGISTLIAVVAPGVQAAREAARRAQSMNNLKQMAIAMHNYHEVHRAFPPAASTKEGKPLLSWRVHILPYIEQDALYKEFHLDEPWDSEHNKKLIEKMPKLYATPGDKLKPGTTSYLAPTGKGMVFNGGEGTTIAKITDGTSNTILLVEADADKAVVWSKPDDLPIDLDKPLVGLGNAFEGGFNAAYCDGSVRFISKKIEPKVFALLLQMADGMVIPEF